MHAVFEWLQGLHGPVVYAVVAALVFLEDALFVGFVFPGETAVVIGGLLASQHRVSLTVLAVIVVVSAIVGDSVGYEIGRVVGRRVIATRVPERYQPGVARAQALIRRRGPAAVFLGRFVALFRALMPALAGSSHMRYPQFLLFNAIGGLVWGVTFTLVGFFAGTAFERVQHLVGRGLTGGIAVLVVVAFVVWRVRRWRAERRPGPLEVAVENATEGIEDIRRTGS